MNPRQTLPPRELRGNTEIERTARAARESAFDPLLDNDDLAPARPNIWIACAWIALAAVMAMLLTA